MKIPDMHEWQSRGIIKGHINLIASKVGFSTQFTSRNGKCAADCLVADACRGVY